MESKNNDNRLNIEWYLAESNGLPEKILKNSKKYLDFFVQMLTDQNFKIVLNTLNVINIIAGMP